jgi:hypothetical protein
MIDNSTTVHVDFDNHTDDVTIRTGPNGKIQLTLACDGTQAVRLYGEPSLVRYLLAYALDAVDKHDEQSQNTSDAA